MDRFPDAESAADLLQRRWIAAMHAAERARERCDLLLESMRFAESAWLKARARLEEMDALRDALADDLAAIEESEPDPHRGAGRA